MATIDVQLDNTTKVNYLGLRESNAFGFNFNISIDETPINASAYEFELVLYLDNRERLTIEDADWTKDGSRIEKMYNSFSLPTGEYTFDLTWTDASDKKVTIVPGTLEIIRRDERN